VIFNQRHLRRGLPWYVDYYHRTRTHLSIDKDCPDPRPTMPRRIGKVVAIPQVGGLHHRYRTPRRLSHQLSANYWSRASSQDLCIGGFFASRSEPTI
jgi:hypothetical protein